MTTYQLHEFDPEKVFTGQINSLEVNSFKYESYSSNTVGQIVIDKNNPIDGKRKFISLVTKKTSQSKFNQVVDIEFAEFTLKNTGAALDFLQAKINSLELDKAGLASGRNTDKQRIDALNKQIASLQDQILTTQAITTAAADAAAKTVNKIPDHLNLNETLKAGSEVNGLPSDRIMSKNRKYVAIIQSDRNLVVYKGEFDERGYALENTAMDSIWSPNGGYSKNSGDYTLKFYTNGLCAFHFVNGNLADWFWIYQNENADKIGLLSNNAKLILEDSGRLVITNFSSKVWASK
jgi:hypothetical protein